MSVIALFVLVNSLIYCLQCFDAVGWAAGRESSLQELSGGVLLCGARCRFAYGPSDATATHCLILQ